MSKTKVTNSKEAVVSSFYIPIALNKSELEQTLNAQIDGTLFDEKITEGSMQIQVTKVASIRIAIQDKLIRYRVPLHIWVKKELLVGDIAAEGDIALDFQTEYRLNPDWTLQTKTELADYGWIKAPKAQVMGFKIPVTKIAERILKTSTATVTEAIDKQANESVVLKTYAQMAWDLLQNPMLFSEDYQSHFKFSPTDLSIAPFQTKKDSVVSALFVQGKTEILIGEGLTFAPNAPLLPLRVAATSEAEKISLNISTEIPYTQIEKIFLKNFKGTAYALGQQQLIVEDLKISAVVNELILKLKTTGVYDGWLTLQGKPAYNPEKNQMELQDISFQLDTQNLKLDSVNWLISGLFTNQLAGTLAYPLAAPTQFLQTQIQAQIANYPIQEGIYLRGRVEKLAIKQAYLGAESMKLSVHAAGTVGIFIESLTKN